MSQYGPRRPHMPPAGRIFISFRECLRCNILQPRDCTITSRMEPKQVTGRMYATDVRRQTVVRQTIVRQQHRVVGAGHNNVHGMAPGFPSELCRPVSELHFKDDVTCVLLVAAILPFPVSDVPLTANGVVFLCRPTCSELIT